MEDKYIGYEWNVKSGEPNTSKSPVTLTTREKRTLSHLNTSEADSIFLNLSLLYKLGPALDIRKDFDKSLGSSGLDRIQAANLGDIAFKPGIPYVTEAIAVDNFLMNSSKIFSAKLRATTHDRKRGTASYAVSLVGGDY